MRLLLEAAPEASSMRDARKGRTPEEALLERRRERRAEERERRREEEIERTKN